MSNKKQKGLIEMMTYEEYLEIGKVEKRSKTKFSDKEFNKESIKKYWDEVRGEYTVFEQYGFNKMFKGEQRDIEDVLGSDNDLQIGKMHRIMRRINKQNMVVYSDGNAHKTLPCDKKLMLKLIGGNEKRAGQFLKEMIGKHLIHEAQIGDCTRYFINPVYTLATRGLTPILYSLFREQLVPFLSEQAVKDLDTLAYFEQNPESYVAMKEEYLARITDEGEHSLDKFLLSLKDTDSDMVISEHKSDEDHVALMEDWEGSSQEELVDMITISTDKLAMRHEDLIAGIPDEVTIEVAAKVVVLIKAFLKNPAPTAKEKDTLAQASLGIVTFQNLLKDKSIDIIA